MRLKMTLAAACLSIGAVLLASAPAHALVEIAVPGSFAAGFGAPDVVVPQGQSVTFFNGDIQYHNVLSVARDSHGLPLFSSATISTGGVADVKGVSTLAPGSYAFICAVHPTSMKATLIVEAAP